MSDSNGSPAALIKSKQFLPYFLTQVMGAFNDNVFKNALILMVTFAAANSLPFDSNIMINAAAGLFILPFFLFSATAGALADNVEKSKFIRVIKLAEVGLMYVQFFASASRVSWLVDLVICAQDRFSP